MKLYKFTVATLFLVMSTTGGYANAEITPEQEKARQQKQTLRTVETSSRLKISKIS